MRIDILEMPTTAKLWVYQADKVLSENEKLTLETNIASFLDHWDSHGNPLKASWKLAYDRFLIIAVDESYNATSGCSVDKSVRFVQDMESQLGVNFLDKTKIALLEKNQINTYELKEIKNKILDGQIKHDTVIFNNLVSTIGEFEKSWQIPASKSWISRYFPSNIES